MSAPLWRQAYDAAERRITPQAERLVRTPTFAVGAALVQRAQTVARDAAQGVSARAWHLLNLPAGSDVSRLRAQIGALDREVRRLGVQLEIERRRAAALEDPTDTEEPHAHGAQPPDGPRPRPARRRAQRPARP
jgi:putative heme degradation protein